MARFPLRTADEAPEAKPYFEGAEQKLGFVPNLFKVMASSPPLLEAYNTLNGLLEKTDLDPDQVQMVLLAVSVENGCDYCVSAHTAIGKQAGLDDAALAAVRDGRPVNDEKLEAIRTLATDIIRERGWIDEERIEAFLAAGFERRHVLDILVGVGMKTLSNYTNHLAETPLDEPLQAHAWQRAAQA